jgi:hypothetical protein
LARRSRDAALVRRSTRHLLLHRSGVIVSFRGVKLFELLAVEF